MARIIVSENITLDGVSTDPTGEEGTTHGGWFTRIDDADRAAWAAAEEDEAMHVDAVLMGRRSYDYFAPRWADRPGSWAERFNSLPKYVLTSSPDPLAWRNSTAVSGDLTEVAAKLKQEVDGDIVVYASGSLIPTLIKHDLVDELRLIVFPVLAGAGRAMLADSGSIRPLRLIESHPIGTNLTHVTYRPA
ncbi:dihydrofolate reductase family protein [Paractinoplanes globisporus]|uniref:Dihydrofolate reductase family protein n=1 Tax=Paractinoplanes globisporus TaxID=113565 RepID=A0ABW6WEV5_9ACTN|nr:dihydrofolate reductase family protein [Actinoplanes globisporus]